MNFAESPNATLAPQARLSGEILNYLLGRYSDILRMIIGLHTKELTNEQTSTVLYIYRY